MSRRVVVTGLGCVTPLGKNVKESWSNLLSSRSGLIKVTELEDYELHYKPFEKTIPKEVSVGKVVLPDLSELNLFTSQDERRMATFSKYAVISSYEALKQAKLLEPNSIAIDKSQVNLDKFGCVIGSGIASINDLYTTSLQLQNERKKVSPLFVPRILTNMAAGNVSIKFNLRGASHSVSTACATGNNSIGDAYNFIRLGMQDICIAGASEASIHPLSLTGFIRAMSITTNGISRPFDKDRSGFVLGEGSGILILEALEHAIKRKANIICEVTGYGLSSDAYHITSPSPEGDGASRAMEMALDGVDKNEISYINAHATSTSLGDEAEILAINKTFGQTKRDSKLNVSSNKGSMGHLLGAAGAVESIFTIKALTENTVPHTLNLKSIDEKISQNCDNINLVAGEPLENLSNEHAICNSFGFGGVNTSILYSIYRP